MLDDIQAMVDRYPEWIRERTSSKEVNGWIEITTPFMDRHNDYLQIYVRRSGNDYDLTDDGYILEDLKSTGCDLNTPKRQNFLNTTLRGFGVNLDSGALVASASEETFSQKKHNLLQAMIAVNDMFYMADYHVASLFLEDVTAWMDELGVRYTPDLTFQGSTGLPQRFDFVIPRSPNSPERIGKSLTNPNRSAVVIAIQAWQDTESVRPEHSRMYAILNDGNQAVPIHLVEALKNSGIRPILWKSRNEVAQELLN